MPLATRTVSISLRFPTAQTSAQVLFIPDLATGDGQVLLEEVYTANLTTLSDGGKTVSGSIPLPVKQDLQKYIAYRVQFPRETGFNEHYIYLNAGGTISLSQLLALAITPPIEGSVTGSGEAGRIAFWDGDDSVTSSGQLLYDDTVFTATIGPLKLGDGSVLDGAVLGHKDYFSATEYALHQEEELGGTYINAAVGAEVYLRVGNSDGNQMFFDGEYWAHWRSNTAKMLSKMNTNGTFEFNVYGPTPKFYFNGRTDFDGDVVISNNSMMRAGTAAASKVLIERLNASGQPITGSIGAAGFAYYDYDGPNLVNLLTTDQYALQQDMLGNTYLNAGEGWNPDTDAVSLGRLYLRHQNSLNQQMVFDGGYWNIEQWNYASSTWSKQYHMSMEMATTGIFKFNVYADAGVATPKFYFNGATDFDGNVVISNNGYLRAGSAAISKVLIQKLDSNGNPISGTIGGGGFAYFDYDGATTLNYLNTTDYALQQDMLGNTYLNAGAGWNPDTDTVTAGRLYLRNDNSKNQQMVFDGSYWNIEQWNADVKQYHMSSRMASTGKFEFHVYADAGTALPRFYFNGQVETDGSVIIGNNGYLRAGSAALSKVLIERLDANGVPMSGQSIGGGGFAYFDYDGATELNYLTTDQYAVQQDMLGNTYVNAGEGWNPTTDTPTAGRLYLRNANSKNQQMAFDGAYWNVEQWNGDVKQYHMSSRMASTGKFEFHVYADAGAGTPKFYFNGPIDTDGSIVVGNNGYLRAGSAALSKVLIQRLDANGNPLAGQSIGAGGMAYFDYDGATELNYLTTDQYAIQQDMLGNTYVNAGEGWNPTTDTPTAGRLYLRNANSKNQQMAFDGAYWNIEQWNADVKQYHMSMEMATTGIFKFNVYADAGAATPSFYFNGKTAIEGHVELGNLGEFRTGASVMGEVDGDAAFAFRGYNAATPPALVNYLTETDYAVRQDALGNTYVNAPSSGWLYLRRNNSRTYELNFDGQYWTHWYNDSTKMSTKMNADGKFEFNVYKTGGTPYFYFNGKIVTDGSIELNNLGQFRTGASVMGEVDGDAAFAFRGYDMSTPAVLVSHLTDTNYALRQDEFGNTYVNAKSGQSLHFRLGNSPTQQWILTGSGLIAQYNNSAKVTFSVDASGYLNILTGNNNQAVNIAGNGAMTIGSITEGVATSPSWPSAMKLDLTGLFGGWTPGNYKNNKLVLYRNDLTTAYYGLGISSGLLEVQSAGDIAFYAEAGVETKAERMRISATGDVVIGESMTKTITVSIVGPTADQVLTSISATTYRSVKYQVQVTSGTDVHITEIRVFHDGTDVYITEYGALWNTAALATFSAALESGQIKLLATPTSGTKTFKILAHALKA